MTDTIGQMAAILNTKLKVKAELGPQSDINELGLDSLDIINFLFSVEEETGVKIPDEALVTENLRTLDDFARYIERHR